MTLEDSEPEPDISVMRGSERDFLEAHPSTAELIIEVAVTSAALDRENASLYAEAGLKEYWIFLGSQCQVEVYRRPENGRYQEMFMASGEQLILVFAQLSDAGLKASCLPCGKSGRWTCWNPQIETLPWRPR